MRRVVVFGNEMSKILDTIDATVFTGDTFYDVDDLNEFKYYLERWTRQLPELEKYAGLLEDDEPMTDMQTKTMPKATTIVKGYTVMYTKTDGSVGFLDSDHASNYAFFSNSPGAKYIYDSPVKATTLLATVNSMRTFYGHEKVVFGSEKLVKVEHVFQPISTVPDNLLIENVKSKVTNEEWDAISDYFEKK